MTTTAPEAERRPDDLLNAAEVAAYLRVPTDTLYRLHREGRLPGMPVTRKHLRWRQRDVDDYLARLGR